MHPRLPRLRPSTRDMPNRKGYDLEEFEELAFGDSAAGITPAEWATFQSRWRTLTTKKLSGCFEFTGSTIKPKNWVGVVESDAFTLQVVPRGSKALSEPQRVRLSRNIDRILRIAISGRTIQVTEADLAAGGSRFDSAVESLCDLVLMARRRKQLRRLRCSHGGDLRVPGAPSIPSSSDHQYSASRRIRLSLGGTESKHT